MNRSKVFFVLNDEEWFEDIRLPKNIPPVHVISTHFQNGELSVHFSETITNKNVILLKRFSANIHEDIFELLQCVDTLNRMEAKTITLLLPYYPYARQDHSTTNESKGALLLAKMLANLGVRNILTIDMHAPEQLRDFPLKIINLTTERFLGNYLRSLGHNSNKIQIMAADKSAAPRARQIATAINCSWGYTNKQRYASGKVQITEIFGFCPEKQTFLVDDLIDTGRTIIAAGQALRKLSAQPIAACVTHCHLTTNLFPRLIADGISQLVTTDTIKRTLPTQTQGGEFMVLKAFPILLEGLYELQLQTTLPVMFSSL